MNADLTQLLAGLTAAIARAVTPGKGLHDPHDATTTASDHYGQTAAALALAPDGTQWPAGRGALDAWLAVDARRIGHLPFNRLLLLLLEQVLSDHGAPDADLQRVRRAIARCALERRYASNNWALLAQCCRLIEASPRSGAGESARFCAMLDKWTTGDGGFIDFPAAPGDRFSTPFAYHHKALFLTALACWFHDDPALVRHAGRLLGWLVHCWDPSGYAGGLGRSNHALFGDGCLVAALVLLGFDDAAPQSPVGALARRLDHQRRPDGLLWLTPAGAVSADASWDRYMHLSVYNAWTAAVVGAARHLRERKRRPAGLPSFDWNVARSGCFEDRQAGIACVRLPSGLNAVLATRGQAPQSFSRDEADFRYAGGVVVHLADSAGRVLIPPPVRCGRDRLVAEPALAGWTPVFRVGHDLFALTDFDDVRLDHSAAGVTVTLQGSPVALTRSTARNAAARALAALDWRLLRGRLGRNAGLRRARCGFIEARLRIVLRDAPPRLAVALELRVRGEAEVEYLNPAGHAVTGAGGDGGWRHADLPSSIPHAVGRCLAPQRLGAGTHGWTLEAGFCAGRRVEVEIRRGADEAVYA